jgi:protein-S-isoprenylcysteine O-methyltransferase Ste14
MIPFLADIDPVFKVLAPRPADWLSILPEIAVAGLSLVCLVQAMFLPKALRSLIPITARVGLVLVAIMALTNGPWVQPTDVASFSARTCPPMAFAWSSSCRPC